MMARIASGDLLPESLIERVVGLEEAATLLPTMDRAVVSGITMIDPARPRSPKAMDAVVTECQR